MATYAASPAEARTVARDLGPWWLFLIFGVAWLVFAFIVLSFKFDTVWAVAVFTGCMFIAGAASELFLALSAYGWRWLHALLAILFFITGIFCFAWPGQTFLTLAAIIGWYLLFKGAADICLAIMARGVELWWVTLILGIAEVLIGFWAVGYAGRSIALLVVWVGATALAHAVTDFIFAFRLRELQRPAG